jgi:2-polyprenyl-3-methyl-5-hydroxy-6-metoxy-1,4-benzoquinol methylase
MPLYKYVGNKILTRFQNRVSGLTLSEWHSGYRAFRLEALARIPFQENSDGFDFDTEVLLQLFDAGARIVEVPIPTYYGDEVCRVNGIAYAKDVCVDVVRYRLARFGFGSSHLARWASAYGWKDGPDSSHRVALGVLDELARPPGRVLDLGCAGGLLAGRVRAAGNVVVGVDVVPSEQAAEEVDRLVVADLDAGLPGDVVEEAPYDLVLAMDVLEHLRDPARLLRELHTVCSADALLIASVPNIAHWYPRLRIGLGRFDYDRRGILDATHLRFFTWRSFVTMAARSGWLADRRRLTGVPLEVLGFEGDRAQPRRARVALQRIDGAGRAVWPSLFAYQYVVVLRPDPAWASLVEPGVAPEADARTLQGA